ncbi:pathway-specific nitrogen regulator [Pleomassaria siparia CBS 279.74]|uniref:Pathway-specific nitrogen regulator n=1 Tax=Pleomassaria siparia CBS 279.74 TaxID=1314801 RepID=A0A6G1KSW9_9PLEO|nr:pathway-specific nitrogen regulator [Pleomassaria siparia CBS 279.74]
MNHGTSSTPSANAAVPQPKPIRFVTNNDGPYAKRRRINSACLTCRKKKTRCSGERPICGTCTQNKHECAGYGADTDNYSPTEASKSHKDTKKAPQRESNASNHDTARKVKEEAAPQPSRPPLPHVGSGTSQNSDSSANNRIPKYEDDTDPGLSLSTRNRMPYFRYFGPTAIMPGFKQMVVKIRGKQHGTGHTTTSDPVESSPGQPPSVGSPPVPEARSPVDIPLYDTSAMSPSPLITHLCKLFFTHLGCNFPFLQRERFLRDLEGKQVDAILVDAVCALAARFSQNPLLTGASDPQKDGENDSKTHPPDYGQAFAQRAKSAIPDTFPCPSVAAVQAALLLAYDEFGASRDSGLWMYLGICIRMSQDLGMQTLQGLRYEGRNGPTPKSVKTDRNGVSKSTPKVPEYRRRKSTAPAEEEQRAVERERLDTFWSIFFLDRVISSGTGRPVTLRDKDIEISFPSLNDMDPASGWPLPFPALIRIIHLYGRVTDLLNSIKEKAHITEDLRKQLDTLEYHLTEIYQGLSPKLHFNALNFQHYVKINQGTNFLLLHCWFHTLIVLLHQPTLLKTFEGSIQPLSSNSRELSMSSAKTVADILVFTDLIDAKTGLGSPFTSQPIYIVACAFLQETALHSASSQPQSRPSTPGYVYDRDLAELERTSIDHMTFGKPPFPTNGDRPNFAQDHDKQPANKHTLLASAANQNYQRCYRALKSMETYWAGVKYILTVLEQKAKGVGDPLLYTREEMESALELPKPEPSFTSPGWRRKLSWGTYLTAPNMDVDTTKVPAAIRNNRASTPTLAGSPMVHPSQAIGWSLTGTMNSPSTNVAVMYTSDNNAPRDTKPSNPGTQPSIASVLSNPPIKFESNAFASATPFSLSALSTSVQSFDPTSMPPPPSATFSTVPTPDPVLVSDADLLLNLHSPYSTSSPNTSNARLPAANFNTNQNQLSPTMNHSGQEYSANAFSYPTPADHVLGDMVIDSQDVDMSVLGADMMPWDLEYLPHDLMFYGDGGFNVDPDEGGGGPEG